MGRFFLWLSGADPDVLRRVDFPRSERTRLGGLGTLVLIPAVLAEFSMTYALSTVIRSPWVFYPAGLLWAAIILAIDRYLVSTIYKSDLPGRWSRVGAVTSRYVFALLLGFVVSHPFVLLFFHESIDQQLAEDLQSSISARVDAAAQDRGELAAVAEALESASGTSVRSDELASTVAELSRQISERRSYRDCLGQLLTAEQSGLQVSLSCGFSSGLAGCSNRCDMIATQISSQQAEIRDLSAQVADAQLQLAASRRADQQLATADSERVETERAEIREQIAVVDQEAAADVEDLRAQFSDDYLARVRALGDLAEKHSHVTVVHWLIVALFVAVDVLAVTMKVLSPKGEYEAVRDTQLMARVARESADREAAQSPEMLLNLATMRAWNAAAMEELRDMAALTMFGMKLNDELRDDLNRRLKESRSLRESPDLQIQARAAYTATQEGIAERIRSFMERFQREGQ